MSVGGFDLNAVLEEVATDLSRAAGIRSASADPAKVGTPGVWVQATGFEQTTLDGRAYRIDLRLVLVTGQKQHGPALRELSDLYTAVTAVIRPTGVVTPARTTLRGTELPSLAVPTVTRWTP